MRPLGVALLALVALFAASTHARAQATTLFAGVPVIKISEGGIERNPQTLTRAEAANVHCVISEIGGKYYWASRENKPLVLIRGGAFNTYIAADGSGYIRVTIPEMKKTVDAMGGAEADFDYVEHLLIGLSSVTYYGINR